MKERSDRLKVRQEYCEGYKKALSGGKLRISAEAR
jgi:hypothetical protein